MKNDNAAVTRAKTIRSSFFKTCHRVLFSLLLSVNLEAFAACESKQLINGWGGEWTPFIMGAHDKPSGLDMDILNAVIEKAGCTWRNTSFEVPWSRHLKLVEAGKIDLATAASWTTDRAKYAYFTHPYRTEYIAIYILEKNYDKFKEFDLPELSKLNFRLGSVRGDVHGEIMSRFVHDLGESVHIVESNDQNLEKLLVNRIDGYIGYPPYDTIALNRKALGKRVVVLPNSLTPTGNVHIMVSKKGSSLKTFEALNQALKALQEDGTIDSIKADYSKRFGVVF